MIEIEDCDKNENKMIDHMQSVSTCEVCLDYLKILKINMLEINEVKQKKTLTNQKKGMTFYKIHKEEC